MRRSDETIWWQAAALAFGTSLTLISAGALARAYGDAGLSQVLAGMGVALALGFVTRFALRRPRR